MVPHMGTYALVKQYQVWDRGVKTRHIHPPPGHRQVATPRTRTTLGNVTPSTTLGDLD